MDIVSRQNINLLIHLAGIEAVKCSSPELDLIKRVAGECNFSKVDLNTLIDSPEPIGSFGALSQSQKKQYMYSLCELMTLIELNNNQRLFCQKVAFDLEYDSNQLNVIIDNFQHQMELNQSNDGNLQGHPRFEKNFTY